jgi:hypothetical protein
MSDHSVEAPSGTAGLLPALALLTAALLVLSGFLLYQAYVERHALLAARSAQDQPLQQSLKVKEQLTALATATAKLADQGHAGAKQIIDAMQREGISVKP